jgi:hypothetical protein
MMREYHMQLSGPWPPYHFVHRLTRTAHLQPQHAVATPIPAVVPAEAPAIAMMEQAAALM